jgi:ferredoxin
LLADIVSPIWHDERSGARANHASSCNERRLVGENLDLCETVKTNDSILSRVRCRMASYSVRINGFARVIESSDHDQPLLYGLRRLGLTAAKFGCGLGQCGACNVLVDGRPTRSCLETIANAEGKSVECHSSRKFVPDRG